MYTLCIDHFYYTARDKKFHKIVLTLTTKMYPNYLFIYIDWKNLF